MDDSTIKITVEMFGVDFPEFMNGGYSVASIQGFINQAYCYVSNENYGVLNCCSRKLAIELMTAHLLALNDKITSGQTTGQIGSTSIDSVSVSLIPPPNKTQFEYWLGLTPYGQRYFALLSAKAPAGLYYGGSFQRVLR